MNINVSKDLNSVFSIKNVNENVSDIEKQNATPKTIESKKEESDSVKEAVYGNVIGVSANGDVASAKEESMKALDDGMVFKKEEVSSLVGYTENQLQEMYQKGEIDKYKYDREVERRAQIRKEEPKQNPVLEQMKETTDEKAQEKSVFADNKTDDKKAAQIAKEDESKEESKDDESSVTKTVTDDAKKADEASSKDIAKDMAKLVSDQQEQTMKANAVKDAIANDRADLIADVFAKNN